MGRISLMIRMRRVTLFRLVRGSNWWYAKIPPLLAVAYAMLLLFMLPLTRALVACGSILICLCSLASFGHIVNDVFDVGKDLHAGKPNLVASYPAWQLITLSVLFAVLGFSPWLWADLGLTAALVLGANYLMPLAYSIPWIRLKEKGVWGVIADSLGVHALPTLFVIMVIYRSSLLPRSKTYPLFLMTALAWAFLTGLRGIIIHQLQDRQSDQDTGVATFVARNNPNGIRRFFCRYVFPLEVLALCALVALLYPFAPLTFFILLVYFVFDFYRHRVWQMAFDPVPVAKGTYITLADFNEVWFPLAISASLAARDIRFSLLLAAHMILFLKDVRKRGHEIVILLKELRRKS